MAVRSTFGGWFVAGSTLLLACSTASLTGGSPDAAREGTASCGGAGEPCCEGSVCAGELTCRAGTCAPSGSGSGSSVAKDGGSSSDSGRRVEAGLDGAGAVPSPYLGAPSAIPGTIQAVDFDLGGPGVAYVHTPLPGEPASVPYRTDNAKVYVGDCVSGTSSCGYRVGYVNVGDWLGYTVNVKAQGAYSLAARISNPDAPDHTMHVEVDGTNVTGTVALPQTSAWTDWTDVTMTMALASGRHFVKVVSDTGDNDWATFTFAREAAAPDAGLDATKDATTDAITSSSPFGTGTAYAPIYMCAGGATCTGTAVTGGGPMPSISGAPDADSCTTAIAGGNVYSCLNALTSVSASTPLVIHSGTYSWTGERSP